MVKSPTVTTTNPAASSADDETIAAPGPARTEPATKHPEVPSWSAGFPLMPVRFEFTHPTAAMVSIAGTFNDWHPTTRAMQPSVTGRWFKEAYLPPGAYEYCLVVDGEYLPDPRAAGYVPNPFGGMNSTFQVEYPAEPVTSPA